MYALLDLNIFKLLFVHVLTPRMLVELESKINTFRDRYNKVLTVESEAMELDEEPGLSLP